ncbi:MAG: hypothetical protein JWO37_131 [Acidimicrobiales bacterium]|jgi:hypothetical protein|nr:hypothetical protein [Acidimicrobiales bacterium]
MTSILSRWRHQRVGAFQLLVGFAVGLLVAVIVLPSHSSGQVVAGRGARSASNGGRAASSDAAGVAGDAGSTASDTGISGGPAAAVGGGGGSGTGAARASSGSSGPAAGAAAVAGQPIKVDVVYADLSALKALGPSYDNGNVPQQWQAMIDGWRRDHLLPVNGHDIQLAFHSYNVLSQADQRSACIAATQDDKAFAVVGVAYFQTGSECVAREHHTPLITFDGPEVPVFQRSAPYLFSIDQASDRLLDNFIYWAEARHAFTGHRIGLYYDTDAPTAGLMNRTIKAELARFGHKVVAEATTGDKNGGPEDAVAVQRFQSQQVDVALLFTSKTGFMQAAQAQGYKPTYLESDFLYGTADVTTSTYPAAQFDGTFGITTQSGGEASAGIPPTPGMTACISNYERFSGMRNMSPSSAAYGYVLIGCDEGRALLDGLRNAGPNLTVASFVSALEGLSSFPLVRDLGSGGFSPNKHDAANTYRTLQWRRGCSCWVAIGDPAPLWIS